MPRHFLKSDFSVTFSAPLSSLFLLSPSTYPRFFITHFGTNADTQTNMHDEEVKGRPYFPIYSVAFLEAPNLSNTA